MKKRIKIFTDIRKQTDFENSIEATQSEANRLIIIFEAFQPWSKITTLSQFEALCSDPINTMDQVLQKNSGINLEATGGKLPAPDMVAKLLNLEYENYKAIITGRKVSETCKPCNSKAKIIKKGESVLSDSTFKQYQRYLIFDAVGRFEINEDLIAEKKLSFQVFAETPEQIKVWNHWNDLCNMLNDNAKKGYIGSDTLDKLPGLFKNRLTFSFQSNRLDIDLPSLLFEISQH